MTTIDDKRIRLLRLILLNIFNSSGIGKTLPNKRIVAIFKINYEGKDNKNVLTEISELTIIIEYYKVLCVKSRKCACKLYSDYPHDVPQPIKYSPLHQLQLTGDVFQEEALSNPSENH